jgi:hypothetical protein
MPEYPGERTTAGLETVGVGGLFPDYFGFWRLEYWSALLSREENNLGFDC